MVNDRIEYIDSIKGIAILLMVMGHVIANYFVNFYEILNGIPSLLIVWRVIYSFHMPLLMFCSGLVVLRNNEFSLKSFRNTLIKRSKTLLLPFVFSGILLHMFSQGKTLGYWFLWMLFLFTLFVMTVEFLCSYIHKYRQQTSTIIIVIAAIAIHLFYSRLYKFEHLPLIDIGHLNQFPYFCMGLICARYNLCEKWFSRNWVYSLALFAFIFLTIWRTIYGFYVPKYSITNCMIPISAIVVFVYLFKNGIKEQSRTIKLVQYIGRHSLEIYILHLFFLFPIYFLGEYMIELQNTIMGVRTSFFLELASSFIISVVNISLCYLTMNMINKSNILSQIFLGRKCVI